MVYVEMKVLFIAWNGEEEDCFAWDLLEDKDEELIQKKRLFEVCEQTSSIKY